MPPRKTPALLPSTLHAQATQKQRMESLEERMSGLIQWHQDLGDRVEGLEQKVEGWIGKVETRIGNLETKIETLSKETISNGNVATNSNLMLRELTYCIVGTTQKGMERPGLADDVKEISRKQDLQSDLLAANTERLKSLERTRATIIMVGGAISTALTGLGFWIWSHTDQLLNTVSDIYGKPKTEVSSPASVSGK